MFVKSLAAAILAAALIVAGGPPAAHAQKSGLVRMAEKDAPLKAGEIVVDTSKVRGSFSELRLYNLGAPLLISNVRVVYSDGSVHNEKRTIDLRKGERTKPIDPKREGKFVDQVVITYKPGEGASGAGVIQVYGEQNAKEARAERPAKSAAPKVAAPANPRAPAAAEPVTKRAVSTSKSPQGRCAGEGNVLLTRANVGFGTDRDRLAVPNNLGKFDAIRLCISDNDIDLIDVKVAFAGGQVVELPYAGPIKAGYRTEKMGLKGDHFIDGIDITYKRKENANGTAAVEIWGELSEKWIDQESELFNDGWVRLTSGNVVGFVGFETDRSPVRAHKRGFRQVRVVVKDRDITLDYLDLIFADGSSQKISGERKRVEPNVGFGPVNVQGGPKVIKEVEARYRSRFFDRTAKGNDRATVEIWGKR
ncbi:MAG: hypothetical protein JNM89_05010 [Hyphomicrobiaceae bacterium]|nr:hypothetical protein [Hyphomicrobiaceae bacterium]